MEDNNNINKMDSTVSVVEINDPPDEEQCIICFYPSTPSSPTYTPDNFFETTCNCNYNVHQKCITQWVHKINTDNNALRCPYCNVNVALTNEYSRFITPVETVVLIEQTENNRSVVLKNCLKNVITVLFVVLIVYFMTLIIVGA